MGEKPAGDSRQRGLFVILALLFVAVLLFTWFTPLLADDFDYAFNYSSKLRNCNLYDVFDSLAAHRRWINARVATHALVMLFMLLPKWTFNLCNAAVLTLGAFGFYRCLRLAEPEHAVSLLACGLALLWVFMPAFGQVFFWLDGACNYAWPMAATPFVIEPFLAAFLGKERARPLWRKILLALLSFLAGACSEHISLSMLAVCALLLVGRIERKSLLSPPELPASLLAGLAGYLTLFFSRTTLKAFRKLNAQAPGKIQLYALLLAGALLLLFFLVRLLTRLARSTRCRNLCRFLPPVIGLAYGMVLCVLTWRTVRGAATPLEGLQSLVSLSPLGLFSSAALFGVLFSAAFSRGTERKGLRLSLILFVGGMTPMALYFLLPRFPARAMCSTVLLAIAASLLLLRPVLSGRIKLRRLALSLAAAVFLLCFSVGTADLVCLNQSRLLREREIASAKAAGEDTLRLSPIFSSTKYSARYGLSDLDPPDAEWPRDRIKDFYGFQDLIVLPADDALR